MTVCAVREGDRMMITHVVTAPIISPGNLFLLAHARLDESASHSCRAPRPVRFANLQVWGS